MQEKIKEFWDKCHTNSVLDSLSGCTYDETIDWLRIREYMKPGINVLEIGVGMCYVTREMKKNGMNVSCLEISEVGIENARQYCDATYMPDTASDMPSDYFDVIICHNVVQHVPTDALIEEFSYCVRALKPGGVFAVEFVSSDNENDMGINPPIEYVSGGKLCRTPEIMRDIIQKSGGISIPVLSAQIPKVEMISGVHIFHVTK